MWKFDFTEDKTNELAIKFSQLNTIEDKFKFWSEKLERPYCLWSVLEDENVPKFLIKVKTEEEEEKINLLSLNQYIELYDSNGNRKKIYDFELLKDSFLKKYDEIPKQREFLLKEIDSLVRRVAERDGTIPDMFDNTKQFYDAGYNDFYLENKKPYLGKRYEINNLISKMNGYTLALFHNFLNDLKNKPVAKDKFTHIQQMLILEYFGIAKHAKTATKKAEIYSPIIRRDEKSTRQLLSQIGLEKNERNLLVIYAYFIENEFSELAQKIKIELDRLKKKKL